MAKALPVMGIVGAVFAVLVVAVLANAGLFVIVLVALAGSLVLLGQRSVGGAVAGLAILATAAVSGLGLAESIATKNGTFEAISPAAGRVLAALACALLPVAAMVLRWDAVHPRWLAYAALGSGAVALLLAATDPEGLSNHGTWRTVVMALLFLVLVAPMVPLLKSTGDDEPRATASAPSSAAPPRP